MEIWLWTLLVLIPAWYQLISIQSICFYNICISKYWGNFGCLWIQPIHEIYYHFLEVIIRLYSVRKIWKFQCDLWDFCVWNSAKINSKFLYIWCRAYCLGNFRLKMLDIEKILSSKNFKHFYPSHELSFSEQHYYVVVYMYIVVPGDWCWQCEYELNILWTGKCERYQIWSYLDLKGINYSKKINRYLLVPFAFNSSHLPRAPCNEFVYDFPCVFILAIVGGYGLRRMCSHSCDFLYGPSGASWGRSVQRLRGDCTKIVQSPDGNRTEPVRLPCRGCAEMVRWPWCHYAIFERAAFMRCPCGDCAMPPMTCLWATDFPLSKIVEAAEPVNPYKNLTAASCLRTEASRRPHGKGIRAP